MKSLSITEQCCVLIYTEYVSIQLCLSGLEFW